MTPEKIGKIKDVFTGKTIIKNPLSKAKMSKYELDKILNCEYMTAGDM